MSLRWIQANREAPTCDEESSDIDDSDHSDDNYDSDLFHNEEEDYKKITRHQDNGESNVCNGDKGSRRLAPCVLWDPRKSLQNPVYRSALIKLYCRTGFHLSMSISGCVRAVISPDDKHGLFVVSPVSFGVIRLQESKSGRYLAFNKKGHLYGERKPNQENTEWEQWTIGNYEAFRSHKITEHSWWIGIKKNGRLKHGPNTHWGQKSIQFVIVGSQIM